MRIPMAAILAAALTLAGSSAVASSTTYLFSATASSASGQFSSAANAVSGTFTIDLGVGAQNVGGVIGSPTGWNSSTLGGDVYGTPLPSSLIVTASVNVGGINYSTPAINDGGTLNGGVHAQVDATAGCNGTCGYAYTVDSLHYYHDPNGQTFGNGQYFSSAGFSLSLSSSTLNWGADGLPTVPATGLFAAVAPSPAGTVVPLGSAVLSLTDGSVLNLDVLSVTALTSAVPLSPSAWFLGSGLLGILGLARRRGAA